MKIKNYFANKKPAQAMLEFAIALPVLLMLLYGILEAGRFLFLYSTVVTASRQAVRYGTTTGDGGGTTPVYGASRPVVPRYDDCAGIRGAGNAVAFITPGGFTYNIAWDKGPDDPDITSPHVICTSGAADEVSSRPTELSGHHDLQGNSTRLIVTASADFVPIVPKLIPFVRKTITASSARTIFYSVPIVVDSAPAIDPPKPTITTITSDTPDPSEIGQDVTVTVLVTDGSDASGTPPGTVQITGADNSCSITLASGSVNGTHGATGSCTVHWNNLGTYLLAARYIPTNPADYSASSDPDGEEHTVSKAVTSVNLIEVSPVGSVPGEAVTFNASVTGGITTPTGTVTVDAGGGTTCTYTLAGGAGGCSITFNSVGTYHVFMSYSGDGGHFPSSIDFYYVVLDFTPTPKPTLTSTPTAIATLSPTPVLSPTPLPTRVQSCTGITHTAIQYVGTTMIMTVNSPFAFPLVLSDVTVTWNDDKGHSTGNKKLVLLSADVNGTPFWTGTSAPNESTKTLTGPATFNTGDNIIRFTFDQSYDTPESTDHIVINWFTPGCEGNGVDSNKQP